MKICFIVGTRPNFIKAFPVLSGFKNNFDCVLVHTGQHYNDNMSKIFFEQLEIKKPDYHLNIKSGSHSIQTADIMVQLDKVFSDVNPDWVFVFGDVNSTLAAALVAKKLNIKIAHVEAGLRSFDEKMPEEINRVIVDRISDLFFVTERSGIENLLIEGAKEDKIKFVGNTMMDSLVNMEEKIDKSPILNTLNLNKNKYCILTLHRPSNVDDNQQLNKILELIEKWSDNKILVWPKHPRIKINDLKIDLNKMKIIEPIGYIEFIKLIKGCYCVFTDSGGIQEETSYLGVKCFTIRENTERPITITEGTNTLIKSSIFKVDAEWIDNKINSNNMEKEIELWDGRATDRILENFIEYNNNHKN